jgi:Zn-finger nucleic acid-binding protein
MQSTFDCPRCRIALSIGRTGDFEAHGCGRCGGVWLDNGALGLLSGAKADSDASHRALKLARFLSSGAVTSADTEPDDLPCPNCREAMLRTRMHDAWIDVDLCPEHGTWFDRGEVDSFARSLSQGPADDWRRGPPDAAAARAMPSSVAPASQKAAQSAGKGARGVAQMLRAVARRLDDAAVEWGRE